MGCINGFRIYFKDLGFKSKDSNICNRNLKWGQVGINLNKLFKDFSNLEVFKISLNIQIQTKA
jgi:preprotein translocase subunit SecB